MQRHKMENTKKNSIEYGIVCLNNMLELKINKSNFKSK